MCAVHHFDRFPLSISFSARGVPSHLLGSGHFDQDNSSDNSTDEKLTNRLSAQPPDSTDTDRDQQQQQQPFPTPNQISSALHSHQHADEQLLLNASLGILRPSARIGDECSNSSNYYDEPRIELIDGSLNGGRNDKLSECRTNILSSPMKPPHGHDLSDIIDIGDVVDLNELPPPPGAPKPENSARLRRYRLNVE